MFIYRLKEMLMTDCGVDIEDLELEEIEDGNEMNLLLDIIYDNDIEGAGEAAENVPIVNDDGVGDGDFEDNMIFEGADYSVNFRLH